MGYIDRTNEASQHRTNRRGNRILNRHDPTRTIEDIDSIVLHNMGFERCGDADAYDQVTAHYAVLLNGLTLKLWDEEYNLNSSNSLNSHSIAIEFEGKFPGAHRRLYSQEQCERRGYDYPTLAQIRSGRQLIRHLINQFTNITHVYAHMQVHSGKGCPGPHIWYNLGRWSTQHLGLINDLPPNSRRFRRQIRASYFDFRYNISLRPQSYHDPMDDALIRRIRIDRELQICGQEPPTQILQRNKYTCE